MKVFFAEIFGAAIGGILTGEIHAPEIVVSQRQPAEDRFNAVVDELRDPAGITMSGSIRRGLAMPQPYHCSSHFDSELE